MSDLDLETVCHDLRGFLSDEVLASGVELADDSVLSDLGVDSFALMEVILFVERRYGIVLPMESLTPENIRSVRTLGEALTRVAA